MIEGNHEVLEALLASVRENPEDDTDRLVIADYVQEHFPHEERLIRLYRGEARRVLEDLTARVAERTRECNEAHPNYPDVLLTFDDLVRAGEDWYHAGRDADGWGRAAWFARDEYQHQAAQEVFDEPGVSEAYWEAFEIFTGLRVTNEDKTDGTMFNCTC